MGGETFKRRLVHGVSLAITYGLKQLCTTVKSFIADMLKCKARLKIKFKCVCVTMCFLLMSPFSRDCIYENENRPIKVSAVF